MVASSSDRAAAADMQINQKATDQSLRGNSDPKPMDEQAVLRDASWCLFVGCCGCGSGPPATYRFLDKCCCCRQSCEPAEIAKDGCCSCICSICACHGLCQFPPRIGTPRFVCCGETYCNLHTRGTEAKRTEVDANHIYDHVLNEGFAPAYCWCCGFSCKQESMALIMNLCKFACCRCKCETASPLEEDGMTYVLSTCANLYCICRCPPRYEHNPICGIAGCRLKTHRHQHAVDGVLSAPAQQEMS
jgi:hypothetical protein